MAYTEAQQGGNMAQTNFRTTSVQLKPVQRARLEQLSDAREVSVSILVRWAIAHWLRAGAPSPEGPGHFAPAPESA